LRYRPAFRFGKLRIAPTTPETCPTVSIIPAGSVEFAERTIVTKKNSSAATAKERPPMIISEFVHSPQSNRSGVAAP
jgi:hypothetical protein